MTAEYITRTAEFGKIRFTAPAADEGYSAHVYIETDKGHAARERRQICHGGDFTGNTVTATTRDIKEAAQKWLRARREWMRNA